MKKLLLSLTIFGAIFSTKADVITVSNNPNSPGQYTDLQTAIDNAGTGDTLLVAGSSSSYGSVTIDSKEVHIVGIGFKPNKQNPYPTELNSVSFSTNGASLNPNGSTIQGCETGNVYFSGQSGNGLSNIRVFKCQSGVFYVQSYSSNITIRNNIAVSVTGGNSPNFGSYLITNNIFTGGYGVDGNSTSNNHGSMVVRNNIFLNSSGNVFNNAGVYNTIVANNIFYGRSGFAVNAENCTFNNNISFNTSNDNFNITGTNSGGSNLVGQDPEFIIESDFAFDEDDDYNVSASSPAINAGTDGSDIGIYGGSYPWPEGGASGSGYMYSQEPQFPQVNEMNIQNAVLPSTQMLDVQVKGITND